MCVQETKLGNCFGTFHTFREGPHNEPAKRTFRGGSDDHNPARLPAKKTTPRKL